MSIRKHKSSSGKIGWRIDVSKTIDGQKVRKTTVVYGQRAIAEKVERRLMDKLALLQAGETEITEPTIGDVIGKWLDYAEMTKRSAKTDQYRSVAVLEYFGEKRRARSITHDDVTRYVVTRRKQKSKHGKGKTMSPATVDRELALIRAAYNHACRNQTLVPPYNPAQWVRPANIPNRRERIISDDEFEKILGELNDFHRMIFLVARFTGLRKSHVLSLKWDQIKDGLIYPPEFDPKKALYSSSKRFGMPPMPPSLETMLEEYSTTRKGYVFKKGRQPITENRDVLRRVRKTTGIDFWFHDIRRTYATHLRRLRIDEYTAKTILGHAALGTGNQVHDRYQTVTREDLLKVGLSIEKDKTFKKFVHAKEKQ